MDLKTGKAASSRNLVVFIYYHVTHFFFQMKVSKSNIGILFQVRGPTWLAPSLPAPVSLRGRSLLQGIASKYSLKTTSLNQLRSEYEKIWPRDIQCLPSSCSMTFSLSEGFCPHWENHLSVKHSLKKLKVHIKVSILIIPVTY